MVKKNQYTMLDTPLSDAVDELIEVDEQIEKLKGIKEEKVYNVLEEMECANKPDIKHSKGYSFSLDHKMAETKLKIKRPSK